MALSVSLHLERIVVNPVEVVAVVEFMDAKVALAKVTKLSFERWLQRYFACPTGERSQVLATGCKGTKRGQRVSMLSGARYR